MKKLPGIRILSCRQRCFHDVLEDTDTTEKELTSVFGEELTAVVKALTKNSALPKSRQMADSLERIAAVGKPAAIVKMCDRITNLQKPPWYWDSTKKEEYLNEAELLHEKLAGFHQYLGARLEDCIENYKQYL